MLEDSRANVLKLWGHYAFCHGSSVGLTMAAMKRLKLDYFALYWKQMLLPLLSCGKGYKGFKRSSRPL